MCDDGHLSNDLCHNHISTLSEVIAVSGRLTCGSAGPSVSGCACGARGSCRSSGRSTCIHANESQGTSNLYVSCQHN